MASANVVNTLIVPASSKVTPYYDDFDESKNFHRIMFRPGYAVQARELTQLQTIIQNQVERFGRHIFVNGSSVIGGKIDISDVVTLNVVTQYANVDVDITEFQNKTITYGSGNTEVVARVLQTSPSINGSPACLHVKYVTGSEFSDGSTIMVANSSIYANISASSSSSNGTIAFIYDSIYFMQGFFIKVPTHSTVVSKHHRQANVKIGLELTDEIIDEFDDTSLLDPAQESSNYQSPGANRYQLTLDLATRELSSADDEKWIEIARMKNGLITKLQSTPIYSEIEEVLARRTYDESGNYIVRPFKVRVQDSQIDQANNFALEISAGKAYVYGFEAENQSPTFIEIPRARNTKSKLDYNIRVNYGNYVIVNRLQGAFNLSGQGIVDLHCVDSANVSVASNAAYYSTKIGTARIRDLNFYGGSSNTTTRQYELYFYNNKFNTITDNAASTSNSTSQIVLSTANSSATANAYTGAYIRIISGNSAGDLRLITDYNGTNKRANVSTPFSAVPNTSSRYELSFDISDVDGFVQWTGFTGGASTNAAASIDMLNKDNGTLDGNTFISEATFGDSFYMFPEPYIAPGISNTSYIYRRVYNSVNFNSGNATITSATNEQFEGETTTSNTSSTIMDNFLVIVTNPSGSARTVGDQVKITATVNNTTPETAILRTGNTSESFTATVYSKMFIRNAPSRVKTLVKANTTTFSTSSADATFVNPTGSTTSVYLNRGQIVIQKPSTTTDESLFISDVSSVQRIYFSPTAPTSGMILTASPVVDVTERFTVDRGHRAEYYDHASIKLKAGRSIPPNGYLIVCCRYYQHTSDVGHFSVDSYPDLNTLIYEGASNTNIGTGYSIIPQVNGIRMADAIDFRPARPNAANTDSWTFNSSRIPVATTNFNCDYDFYRERKDIVVMTVNDELKLITGDTNGSYHPPTPAKSLLLHRLRVLPYTINKSDILVESLEHKRYTMADIGVIDRRVKNMEYNVALNFLEKNTQNLIIKDVNGLDRTKYGILAEDFSSHLLADTSQPDYSCAVDVNGTFSPTGGIMMPRVSTKSIALQANNATSSTSGVTVYDDKAMLAFTTVPAIVQDKATKSSPVAEYLFGDFRGNIITSPEQDIWKDVTTLPPQVASIPKPVIQFDINMEQTTVYTTINNTTINNTTVVYPTPAASPTNYDKLLLTYNKGFANLGQLKWTKTGDLIYPTVENHPWKDEWFNFPTQIWQDGYFYGDYGTPDLDGSGRQRTTAMTNKQLYELTRKGIDASGYPLTSGRLYAAEDIIEYVYDMYDAILNRPPDFPGLCYWVASKGNFNWSKQKLREVMTQSATQNGELSSAFNPATTVDLTPTYYINQDLNAALIGDKPFQATDNAGNYESFKTPEGREALVARTPETLIESYYETYLGRRSDPLGFQFWLGYYNVWVAEKGGGEAGRKYAADQLDKYFRESPERQQMLGGDSFESTFFE